jgi:myo-inositol-1-phosphate synthase
MVKLALDRGISGTLEGPSAYLMKSPPIQYHDEVARAMTEAFINQQPMPSTENGAALDHANGHAVELAPDRQSAS